MLDINKFQENGYAIIKGVFEAKEIENFRNYVYQQVDLDSKKERIREVKGTSAYFGVGDILSKEKLKKILLDDRVIRSAKKALGSEDIIYFGDSSYQVGSGQRGWHRDNVDREFNVGPDWEGEYTIIRMGLYLQNHKAYSGGLKVKKGSHKQRDGKPVFIDNEEGDLVVWSLKTIHSGNAVRCVLAPNYSFNHLEKYIPDFLKKKEEKERISLFMTFAVKSTHLDNYLEKYYLKREDLKEHIKYSTREEEDMNIAKSKGVVLMNVKDV